MERYTAYQLRSRDVEVVFEDEHILVLDKPSGLLVLPDRYDVELPNLFGLLRATEPEILVVHRLDRDTSGVIVFAKTAPAHADLNAQFEAHEVRKRYTALCRGASVKDEGTIDLPLGERGQGAGRMRVDEKRGKPSVTAYRILERFLGFSVVEALPKTGRTHQIRVHLAEIGMPIVADPLYGDGEPFRLSTIKRNYRTSEAGEKPLLARTALHATSLTLRHPAMKEERTFESPLPKDMRSTIRAIRKYAPLEARSKNAE